MQGRAGMPPGRTGIQHMVWIEYCCGRYVSGMMMREAAGGARRVGWGLIWGKNGCIMAQNGAYLCIPDTVQTKK